MKIKTIDSPLSLSIEEEKSLHKLQAICWGSSPFGEGTLCNNCKRVHSLEEIYGNKNLFSGNTTHDMTCRNCSEQTDFIYLNEEFSQEILDYFRFHMCLVLLLGESGEVFGFGLMVKKTIAELLDYELNTRPNSYHHSELLKQGNIKLDEEVLCLQQIYLSPEARGGGFAFQILRELFAFFPGNLEKKFLLETHFGSNFYPISRGLGLLNIATDPYGYVIQVSSSINDVILQLGEIDQKSKINSGVLGRYKLEAQRICNENPNFMGEKFYH